MRFLLSKYWTKWKVSIAFVLSFIYLAIVFISVAFAMYYDFKISLMPREERWIVIFIGLVIIIMPTFYWWFQSVKFEIWVLKNDLSDKRIEYEKSLFKINSDFARTFWGIVVMLFVAFIIKAK